MIEYGYAIKGCRVSRRVEKGGGGYEKGRLRARKMMPGWEWN